MIWIKSLLVGVAAAVVAAIVILVITLATATWWIDAGAGSGGIGAVNLGGIHHRTGRRERLRYVFLAPEEERDLEALAADNGDLAGVEREVFQLREEQIAANRRVGAAQQRLAVLDDLRKVREQLMAERAEATLLIQRLKVLDVGADAAQLAQVRKQSLRVDARHLAAL